MDKSHSLELRKDQIDLLRWAIRVASNAVTAMAEEGNFPADDAVTIIARLDDLDLTIYNNVACEKCEGPCECGELKGSDGSV